MLYTLFHDILPVFAILAVGFGMGRGKMVSLDEARALNRVAFLVLQPPLIFLLITGLDLPTLELGGIGIYAVCEIVVFWIGFAVARFAFDFGPRESMLLGMTVIFVNSLLYIWPISVLIYGEAGALPITTVVALDATITFSVFIMAMELTSGGGLAHGARQIARNPVILTIALAVLLNLFAVPIPEPVQTATRFAGNATAPITLFALGVVLSSHRAMPSAAIVTISAMKLFLMPLAVWGLFLLMAPQSPVTGLFVLNAAGQSGAMAFSLALLYGVRTDTIAPVIIWTSLLSLISLAFLA